MQLFYFGQRTLTGAYCFGGALDQDRFIFQNIGLESDSCKLQKFDSYCRCFLVFCLAVVCVVDVYCFMAENQNLLLQYYQCCSRDHMLRDRDRIIFSRPRPRPRPGVFRDPWFETETSKNRDQDRDRQLFGLLKQI